MDIRTLFTRQLNYQYVDELVDPTLFDELTPSQRPITARVMFEGLGVRLLRITLADLRGDAEKPCIRLLRRHYTDVVYLFADSIYDTDATRYHLCNEKGKQLELTADKQRLFMEKVRFFDVADDVTGTLDLKERIATAFDTEKITKTFYREFEKYRDLLLSVIKGIPQDADKMWYASVLLNRLMFIYFIQKHGLIGGDREYLRNHLTDCEQRGTNFYASFLTPLFFMGFATQQGERGKHEAQLKDVPYLNGGLFLKHPLEEQYPRIAIENSALRTLLDYFNKYNWYLDDRPLRDENEINPDVLGYIFEKYVNQKQMGAYYTKEDITGYICRNTILPFLLSKLHAGVASTHPITLPQGESVSEGAALPLPITTDNIERYIYEAVKTEARLPTETDREYAARRKRFAQIKQDAADGKIAHVNDLITWNLDIIRYTSDAVDAMNERALRYFYFECLQKVTVLDPTCGSGAFLFAALNILLPLYQGSIGKMRDCMRNKPRSGFANEQAAFRTELSRIGEHANERYYIVKSIIVNNLHGVDIMEEATEICKLRLFLRLAAEIGDATAEEHGSRGEIEPLPDIDFNIKAGNSLVGFATREEVKRALETEMHGDATQGKMFTGDTTSESAVAVIERKCAAVDRVYQGFHRLQTQQGIPSSALGDAKHDLTAQLDALNDELNHALAREYSVSIGEGAKGRKSETEYARWLKSHQPFHWFAAFYGILSSGGFDVIVGNPPYLDFKDLEGYLVHGYETLPTRNLYPLVIERCYSLCSVEGRQGYIVPVSSVATEGYITLQKILVKRELWYSSYDDRPSHLFDGLDKNTLSIILVSMITDQPLSHSTRLHRWSADERPYLFDLIGYQPGQASQIHGCLPKLSYEYEVSIWRKLFARGGQIRSSYASSAEGTTYYSRKVNAFLQVLDFTPEVRDGKGKLRPPSEFKELNLYSKEAALAVMCCLNSSLFRWFLDVVSDGSHLNKREIDNFPFDARQVLRDTATLPQLAKKLTKRLLSTTELRVMRYTHDTLTVQCIFPKYAKPIIDEIDRVLAQHYGFTDEELDYIINYDIKYRMGRDAEAE